MRLEELLSLIREKWEEFSKAELHSFSEFVNENGKPKRGVLNYGGVYMVYEGDEPIYVGSVGNGKHVGSALVGVQGLFRRHRFNLKRKFLGASLAVLCR